VSNRCIMKTVKKTAILNFEALLASCSEELRPASMDGVTYVVYEEFVPYRVMEQNLYRLAGRSDVGLCPAVRAEESQSGELESLLRAAARRGVPVNAWLLLPEEDGYWFNEENILKAREQVFSFLDWIEERGIPLKWIMFDMEMSIDKVRAMEGGGLVDTVIPLLKENVDPATYEASTQDYAEFVGELREQGYKVTAAAYPFVLDDLQDGDFEIQDAWNTPVFGVGFDEIYFMVYRTSFARLLGITPGPDLVYQYAVEARREFGGAGIMALGIVGDVGMVSEEGYTIPADLGEDVAAAYAGGSERVYIYSLDGMLTLDDPDAWLDLAGTPEQKPEPDDVTGQVQEIIGLMDSLF
jgi:hypothetical protein